MAIRTLDNLPYYRRVPKDFRENLKFRAMLIRRGYESHSAREELWIACKRDPLFWVNAFIYTFDPRRPSSAQPFITYEFQDQTLLDIYNAIGRYDAIFPKSRDMGLTWECLLAIGHQFQFLREKSFMLGSRKEDLVDKTDDPDSLMWKLDYMFEKQPSWLRPIYHRSNLHFGNKRTRSVIDGESTNGDLGRGGRRTAIMLDELASVKNAYAVMKATRDNTPCRLMPSTPQGAGNAFYDLAHDKNRFVRRIHWSLHPVKAKGLYHDKEGKARSPWYDNECKRAANPQEIAQELDIDFHGSDYSFFDPALVERLKQFTARPPIMRGNLEYHKKRLDPIKFTDDPDGPIKLWMNLVNGAPPIGRDYVFGADIAMGTRNKSGTGASNSTIVGVDCVTGEQVLGVTVSGMQPGDFARLTVALLRWYTIPGQEGPLLIPEANGPGGQFIDKVVDAGYRRIYRRQKEDEVDQEHTQKLGWWSSRDTKRTLLGEFAEALHLGDLILRDVDAIDELRYYRHERGQKIVHSRSEDTEDPGSGGDNHGDRVIGGATANLGLQRGLGSDTTQYDEEAQGVSIMSMAGRQAAREAEERRRRNGSWIARSGNSNRRTRDFIRR